MRLLFLLCHLGLILRAEAQLPPECDGSGTNRPPLNSDITVVCGTEYIDVSILLCPVYQAFYNESLMVLNDQRTPECRGTADFNANPPVLKYRFPLNETDPASCKNNFKTITQVGSGQFSDISKVQYINVSGYVYTEDPSLMISYNPTVIYKFSCFYPMQYLVNNTRLAVSGVNLAISDNNGSFISTLTMVLYSTSAYDQVLIIPIGGLELKTKIYVAVHATNLTDRFHVLLDRCYATINPDPLDLIYYDLFVGCTQDPQTIVILNGKNSSALFSFEAFRFVYHKNMTVSIFYLHCITRLCEVSTCKDLLPKCDGSDSALQRRRRREAPGVSDNATVTSHVIKVGKQTTGTAQTFAISHDKPKESDYSGPVVAVIVCIIIMGIVLLGMAVYLVLFIRKREKRFQ